MQNVEKAASVHPKLKGWGRKRFEAQAEARLLDTVDLVAMLQVCNKKLKAAEVNQGPFRWWLDFRSFRRAFTTTHLCHGRPH